MEARIKATGEIIEVKVYKREHRLYIRIHGEKTGEIYRAKDLDFNIEDDNTPDYWTRLEHTYAGMAMQGILSNTSLITVLFDATKDHDELLKEVIICSHEYAHALVQKLKNSNIEKEQ